MEIPGPAQVGYPASQVLGYVGTINSAELKARASQDYQAGDPFGQSGLEFQYEKQLRGTPGKQELEVNPEGQVVASRLKTVAAVPGDNVVTNIDTGLQQVTDNALATQVLALRRTLDPKCNNNSGCYPAATGGAAIVMDPRPAPSTPCPPTRATTRRSGSEVSRRPTTPPSLIWPTTNRSSTEPSTGSTPPGPPSS